MCAANGAQVGAGARSVFEQHGFGVGQAHDIFHGIVHGLDKAGCSLWVTVGVMGNDHFSFFIVPHVAGTCAGGVTVHLGKTHVEPDRAVECAVLVDAGEREVIIEILCIFRT